MRTRTTITAVSTAIALVAGVAAVAQAAPLRLTPTGASTQDDFFVPLAGSTSMLVLTKQPRLPRDTNLSATADARYSSAPDEIYLRTPSGTLTELGPRPTLAEATYSLAGSTLAVGKAIDDDSSVTNQAYVWRTGTGQRANIDLPAGDVYLAAAPDGVLFVTATGKLDVRTFSGATTTLATPFGTTTRASIIAAAVDSTGVVVSDTSGGIAFVRFAAPHTVSSLQNPTPGSPIACYQVAGADAACAEAGYDADIGGYDAGTPVIEPVGGGAPTVGQTPSGCDEIGRLAIAGSTELWTCEALNEPWPFPFTLQSLSATGVTSTSSAASFGLELVSAYGKAVAVSAAHDAGFRATSASAVAGLVAVTPSPIKIDTFGLSSTRVIYSDNQPVGSSQGQVESDFDRSLSITSSGLHAGPPQVIGATATGIAGNLVGASTSVEVYATGSSAGGLDNAVLHVVTRTGTTTIPKVVGQGQIQVSGSRVLYQTDIGSRSDVNVYNALNGLTTSVREVGGIDYHGFALSGPNVVYATVHGAIWRLDLATGQRVKLRDPLPSDAGGVEFDVYASGDWAGWHALPVSRELAKPLNQVRNMVTMAPAVSLSRTLYSLTSAGPILSSTHATFRMGFAEAGEVSSPTRFWLRSYSGTTTPLLPSGNYLSGPQIAGRLLAWADADGVLRARLLNR
jgi:hypothetical protein